MAEAYSTRPSEIMEIKDEYTAYCLDEALAYIVREIKGGKTPAFTRYSGESSTKQFAKEYAGKKAK